MENRTYLALLRAEGDEYELTTGSIWGISNFLNSESRIRQGLGKFILASEPQSRVRGQDGSIALEHERRAERDQRSFDAGHVYPEIHGADTFNVCSAVGFVLRPSAPGLILRDSALEDKLPSGPERPSHRGQCHQPVIVGDEDLGDIPCHGGKVDLEWWKSSCIPMDPANAIRSWLRPSNLQRCCRRIEPNNVKTSLGKQAGKGAGSATDV